MTFEEILNSGEYHLIDVLLKNYKKKGKKIQYIVYGKIHKYYNKKFII